MARATAQKRTTSRRTIGATTRAQSKPIRRTTASRTTGTRTRTIATKPKAPRGQGVKRISGAEIMTKLDLCASRDDLAKFQAWCAGKFSKLMHELQYPPETGSEHEPGQQAAERKVA